MHYIWIGFIGGILAFVHCLGMCGGFALHLSQGQSRLGVFRQQLLWHLGKTTTYVFLGALAGFAGNRIGAIKQLPWLQDILTYIVGAVMILMALSMFGLVPTRLRIQPDRNDNGLFSSLFQQFFYQRTPTTALALGLATGFLPCPIVVGFLALSMQSESILLGIGIMGAMGIGTLWALLLLGMTGHLITFKLRKWSPYIAGIVLLLLGTATIARGTKSFHRVLGCSHSDTPVKSCCHRADNLSTEHRP